MSFYFYFYFFSWVRVMYGVSVFLHTTKGEEEEYENGGKEGGLITKTGGNTKAPALRMGRSNATTHEKKSLESDLGMLGNKSMADYSNRGGGECG